MKRSLRLKSCKDLYAKNIERHIMSMKKKWLELGNDGHFFIVRIVRTYIKHFSFVVKNEFQNGIDRNLDNHLINQLTNG
jgi:hypothetical protein